MRYFNQRSLELLAPAGNFEIFKSVVKTGCDAIYFGGQSLNMRMIRKGFNFSDEALKDAVQLGHASQKRCYITVNNLISEDELDTAKRFLTYLAEIGPDAVIVQDMAILQLIESMGLPLPVHASVMMNVHNTPMVKVLQARGVSRVVLSREMSLADAKALWLETGVETEYFAHGDMCIAHGSQCYHSSFVFGMSSNRGRCLKPCRWGYQTAFEDVTHYPMAVKDLSMYRHLPEMIEAGITSFKIEGRMREAGFITTLIDDYAEAMDRYCQSPETYDRDVASERLFQTRKRDLSTAYAFGRPGRSNINTRYEGTGKFYSTGKVFSVPTSPLKADKGMALLKDRTNNALSSKMAMNRAEIIVKVNNAAQAEAALNAGADRIILNGDVLLPDRPWSTETVLALYQRAEENGQQLYVGLPRMLWNAQITNEWLAFDACCHGYSAGNFGALAHMRATDKPIHADFSLNTYNHLASDVFKAMGAQSVTLSVELKQHELMALLKRARDIVVVYGRLATMYFEHDFYEAMAYEGEIPLTLKNEGGSYEIYKDSHGRNHLFADKVLNLLQLVPLIEAGGYQIEGQCLQPEEIAAAIRQLLKIMNSPVEPFELTNSIRPEREYTLGAFAFE